MRRLLAFLILFVGACDQSAVAQDNLCERGAGAANMFRQGIFFEHLGLKTLAVGCYDLARQTEPLEYRYHRAYIRAAHQIGRQADIFEEYNRPANDPHFEVIRLTLLARLHEYDVPRFVEYARQAVQMDPNDVWAVNALGAAHDVAGERQLAVQVLEDAYKRFDRQPETSLILANVLTRTGSAWEKVFDLLGEAERDQYYRPYARAFRGFYTLQKGEANNGLAVLRTNIEEYPHLGLTYIFLGDYYLQVERNLERAKKAYFDGISRNLTDAIFYNNAAWNILGAAQTKGDVVTAIQLAISAVTFSSRRAPAILDTLAEARFKSGQDVQAVELATEALSLGPPDQAYYQKQLEKFRNAKK